jgi:hypothetical protein
VSVAEGSSSASFLAAVALGGACQHGASRAMSAPRPACTRAETRLAGLHGALSKAAGTHALNRLPLRSIVRDLRLTVHRPGPESVAASAYPSSLRRGAFGIGGNYAGWFVVSRTDAGWFLRSSSREVPGEGTARGRKARRRSSSWTRRLTGAAGAPAAASSAATAFASSGVVSAGAVSCSGRAVLCDTRGSVRWPPTGECTACLDCPHPIAAARRSPWIQALWMKGRD